MAIGGIVASNFSVDYLLVYLVDYLNTGCELHLFSNNFTPTPASILSNFTEATYTGYAAISLDDAFDTPVQIIAGEYQSDTDPITFTAASSGTSNTIYGYYITDADSNVLLSQAFSAPVLMGSGSSFQIVFNLQNWALAIVS